MAKMPVEWHEKCLMNRYNSLARKKDERDKLIAAIEREQQEATFYHVQIHNAKTEGKPAFDSERYKAHHKHLYVK